VSSSARSPRVGDESVPSYDAVFKLLHWTVVALLIVQLGTKLIPSSAVPGGEDTLDAWHVSVGPTILFLMVLRLLWRLFRPVPPPPADLSPGLQVLSRATHWALYALLIGLPILGWLAASAYGVTPYLFGLIPLPRLLGTDETLAHRIGIGHGVVALVLLIVIGMHVSGALYHAAIRRDGVIWRMLP
jgi:cytochrome b561